MPERSAAARSGASRRAARRAAGSVSDMTGVDWIIVGLLLLLALFGWAQGFVTGALALVGFALGAWLGTRLAGLVLSDGSRSPYAPAIGLVGALCLGAGVRGGLRGARLPPAHEAHAARASSLVDGLLGALLTALVGLGVVWIVGAVAVHSPGDLRYEVQRSQILSRLNKALPPSGPLLNALARFDPFPRIDGPEAQVAAPKAGIARDPEVAGGGARAWSRCSAPPAGSASRARAGWRRDGPRGDERPRRRRARTTRACCCAAASPGWTPPLVAFDAPQRHRRAARRRARREAAADRRGARARAPRRRSSASRTTAPTTCAPRGWGRRARP